ncbi:MAG: hypothetical protein AMJ84_00195 [Acidithiobacillales bacterium SM23_46]|nr:MAG: hypothetical protein AMJ84_00195 [Acidithiobacillales bacterium SM23_46]KPL29024.1 MAG: hypothetical protein AMJ72_00255 [Acidithiobacillales bacterium SM1_46]
MPESYLPELRDYSEVKREEEQRQRLAAGNAVNVEPNRASRILELGGQTGLPLEVIDADFDNISQLVEMRKFDPDQYRDSNPKWLEFAADNPYHLSVLKADKENLTRMERAFRPIQQAWHHSWAMQELGEIGARQQEGVFLPGDEERIKELKKYSVDHDFDTSGIHSLVVALTKQSANFIGAWESGAKGAMVGGTVGATTGAITGGTIFPVVGAGPGMLAGWSSGLTIGFGAGAFSYSETQEGGHAYLEYREMGFSHEDAAWAATIVGNLGGAAEALGGGVLLSKLPGIREIKGQLAKEVVADALKRKTFRDAVWQGTKDFGIGMTSEIATEIFQESVTMAGGEALKYMNDRDDYLTREQVIERIGAIAAETMKSTVLLAGAGGTTTIIRDGMKARRAKQMELVYQALGDSAEASRLRQEVPKTYQDFVSRVTADGDVQSLHVDVEQFDQYWQEKGHDPDEVAAHLNVKKEDIELARERGGTVEIPINDYATKIAGTEHHQFFQKHITSDPETQMSAHEADLYDKNKPAMISELEELAAKILDPEQDVDEQIINDVVNQLVATDAFDPQTARTTAEIMRGIPNLARRAGEDPMQLYKQFFGGVRRVLADAHTDKDIDAYVDPYINMLREGTGPKEQDLFGTRLSEFLRKAGGVMDEGGELSAMDAGKAIRGLVKRDGMTLATAAEKAAEAGYIASRDENLLVEAIRDEIGGKPVLGPDADPQAMEMQRRLDELEALIGEAGLDLNTMTNAEVREALDALDTFDQMDDLSFQQLVELVGLLDSVDTMQDEQYGVDHLVQQVMDHMPDIWERQDFGDLTFTDRVRVRETGKVAELKVAAQRRFDAAVERRNLLKKLRDCVSG